jgi:uncharacterized protein (DUF433 family)
VVLDNGACLPEGAEVKVQPLSEPDRSRIGAGQPVHEIVGGEPYEYFPLGEHIVSAPGVCGGRPTFKYTRIDVRHAIALLSGGWTVEAVARSYEIPVAAVQEALDLAMRALTERAA